MLYLRMPERHVVREYLEQQAGLALTYAEVGATDGQLPPGYFVNHTRRELGSGDAIFDCACEALRQWRQLQLGWVNCWPTNTPLRQGEHIAVIGDAYGLVCVNACRIVYTIDEKTPLRRFGYAHGTLPDHIACGEERFLIETSADGRVILDILSFSRPNTRLARWGAPLMRASQRRFGRESADAMVRWVQQHAMPNATSPAEAAGNRESVLMSD